MIDVKSKVVSFGKTVNRRTLSWIVAAATLPLSACTSTVQEADVEFIVDSTCRNGGFVEVEDVRYGLLDAAPFEWQSLESIRGEIVGNDRSAIFTSVESDDVPSFSVRVTTEPRPVVCLTWERSEMGDG